MSSKFSFAHLYLTLLIPVCISSQGDRKPSDASPRIVGTDVAIAPEDRFPYMCSLRRNGDATHVCGAFVVDKRWVVTAAHCVDPNILGTTGFAAEIYCGIHFVNDDNPEQRYTTISGIVHEAWTGNFYEGYDIAMLRLDREVKSSIPRLNFAGNPPKRERSIGAIGWGKLNEFAFADELRITLRLRVVNHTECDAKWETVMIQKDMMICTSVDRADTCDGDSGGPLFLPHMPGNRLAAGNPSRDLIYGITSFGTDGCKIDVEDNRPAVYTSTGFFSEWIQQVINNDAVMDSQIRKEQVDSSGDDGTDELLKMIIAHIIDNYKFGTRSILEKGLDPNSTFSNSTLEKGDVNASLLHLAAWLNSDESAEVLLNNDAEVDATDTEGRTPLHYAAEKGHLKIAEMLIENGANVDAIDNEGETPLIDATFEKHLAVVRLLIERGADVNMQDNDGDTALHEASFRGALQIVVALISNGANLNAMDNDKETPLHKAAEFGYPEIVETLVLAEAKVDKKDKNGNRPIDVICMRAQPACTDNTYTSIGQSLSS